MDYFCILVVIQIIAESFPISSSGHVAFAICFLEKIISVSDDYVMMYTDAIDHFLHGPTLVVIAFFFYKQWISIVTKRRILRVIIPGAITLLFFADGITVLCYISIVGKYKVPLWIGFAVTAFALASLRFCVRGGRRFNRATEGIVLGLAQSLAFFPGISRFGLTYVAARWLKIRPDRAFQLSIMVYVPLILVSFMKSLGAIHACSVIFTPLCLMAIIGATCIAYGALFLVQWCIKRNQLWMFSWYMMLLSGGAFWFCLI